MPMLSVLDVLAGSIPEEIFIEMTHLLTIFERCELITAVIFSLEHTIQNEPTNADEHKISLVVAVKSQVRPPDRAWHDLTDRREEKHLTAEALPILFLYLVAAYQNQRSGFDYPIQKIVLGEFIVLTVKLLAMGYLVSNCARKGNFTV